MTISLNQETISFNTVPLHFKAKSLGDVYAKKNNKTLGETLSQPKYQKLRQMHIRQYSNELHKPLGEFLHQLKDNGDHSYKLFLNGYGDELYCEFSIREHLGDRGIYLFSHNGKVKYIGRCTDSFDKRVNYGYGKIYPKNCFLDGQATNCRLNAIINNTDNIEFGVYVMNGSSTEEIKALEKRMLLSGDFDWNIQKN
jgi:hypothetical protein